MGLRCAVLASGGLTCRRAFRGVSVSAGSGRGWVVITGDLVSCGSDGQLRYLGRADAQVKVLVGIRLSLGRSRPRAALKWAGVRPLVIAREDRPGALNDWLTSPAALGPRFNGKGPRAELSSAAACPHGDCRFAGGAGNHRCRWSTRKLDSGPAGTDVRHRHESSTLPRAGYSCRRIARWDLRPGVGSGTCRRGGRIRSSTWGGFAVGDPVDQLDQCQSGR